MERIKKAALFSALVLLVSGLMISIHLRRTTPMPIEEIPLKRPIVTVFVHGTFHLPIMPKPLIKFVHNCIDSFIFAKKGLHKVASLEEHYAGTWTKRLHNYHMIKTISDADPEKFPFDSFYVFGWSGQLCPQKRFKDAQKLHKHLVLLVAEYTEKHGIGPHIQLITHSHGGNVALNLARINDTSETPISVEELILLACPVQYETSHYIHHATFKKIYSLHSHWDIIQVIDAQGWIPFKERVKNIFRSETDKITESEETEKSTKNKCFFSERHFEPNSKLVQANINFGRRGMFHVEFISDTFMQQLPALLTTLDTQKEQHILDQKACTLHVDLNPLVKQARRERLACLKAKKRSHSIAQQA